MIKKLLTFFKEHKVLFITLAVVIILDKLTKTWIQHTYALGASQNVIGEFFKITYIENHGIALGMLSTWSHPLKYILLLLMSLIALFFLIQIYIKSKKTFIMQLSFGLIFGGAFGNIYDRVIYQRVIDFLNFGIGDARFPFFNIADSSISIGVALLIIITFFIKEKGE